MVTLTDEGRQVLLANRKRRDEWLASRLAELDRRDRQVLAAAVDILDKVNHA